MFPFFAARSHFRRMDVVSLCTRRRPFAGILRNRHHGISYAAWYILGRLQPAVQKDTHTGTDAKNNRMYSLLPCPDNPYTIYVNSRAGHYSLPRGNVFSQFIFCTDDMHRGKL